MEAMNQVRFRPAREFFAEALEESRQVSSWDDLELAVRDAYHCQPSLRVVSVDPYPGVGADQCNDTRAHWGLTWLVMATDGRVTRPVGYTNGAMTR